MQKIAITANADAASWKLTILQMIMINLLLVAASLLVVLHRNSRDDRVRVELVLVLLGL